MFFMHIIYMGMFSRKQKRTDSDKTDSANIEKSLVLIAYLTKAIHRAWESHHHVRFCGK